MEQPQGDNKSAEGEPRTRFPQPKPGSLGEGSLLFSFKGSYSLTRKENHHLKAKTPCVWPFFNAFELAISLPWGFAMFVTEVIQCSALLRNCAVFLQMTVSFAL